MDEGIEAMLCCWLQQLQEFGGPEVDKPDLLKGSIGSLKNIGLANTTVKNNSGSGSLAKHNAFVDRRARYNVSIQNSIEFRLEYIQGMCSVLCFTVEEYVSQIPALANDDNSK